MRMTVSDEDLAGAAACGDARAFEALLARHYDRLFGLCFRLTGNRAEAEDLCQDICAVLPARISSYRGQSKVTTWLYRVAVNAAIDRRRKATTYAKALDGWGNWEIGRQAAIAEEQDNIGWLHAAMGQLSETLRDTLALVLDDLTHAEVGDILGVSEGTVSWRLSEARKRLREMKEKEEAT
jgi:RNA polymerase sigma-70 factor, ECF subfamily